MNHNDAHVVRKIKQNGLMLMQKTKKIGCYAINVEIKNMIKNEENKQQQNLVPKVLTDIKVNCADPGATATDLNGERGKQTVTEGTDVIIQLATIGKDGPSGIFMNREGKMPW